MTLSFPAFAKVNLDLRVLGVRADGYHDLRTIFQSLALADHVTVKQRAGAFELRCDEPGVPTDRRFQKDGVPDDRERIPAEDHTDDGERFVRRHVANAQASFRRSRRPAFAATRRSRICCVALSCAAM